MTRMPTLEQRVGQRRWNSAAGTLEPSSGGWVRTFGDWSEADLNTGTSYDVDTWGLQAGFDLPVEPGEDGQWVLGLTAQTGNTSADIATMTGTGAINAESLGVGATATWHGYNDLYVDLQGQVNWASVDYSSSLHGQLAEDELARTAAASIEVGRRFALDENRGLIPQAQLTWASVDGGSFTDSAGNAIDLGTNERVTGRLGVAYDYEWSSDDGESMQNVYAIANVLHDFSNDASVGMAGARLASERDATWGEIGLGGSVTWDENKTLYAEASYRDSFGSGSGSGFSANAGLRVQW
jgi:fibronectin-binding autotransporter adhesin